MHGRPRKPLEPENKLLSLQKATELRILQSQLLHNHHNKIYTKEALDLSAKLLGKNPEFYTAWNYRKLFVEHYLLSETDKDLIKSALDGELKTVEIALGKNPKSYGAWHHRKWILQKGLSSSNHEFNLLKKFQSEDRRNFHSWDYVRFLAALGTVSEEEELEHTKDTIVKDISNYSAWHYRSSYLLKQISKGSDSKETVLEEFEYVRDALFIEPYEQSGWFYHFWLLNQTMASYAPALGSAPAASKWQIETIVYEIAQIRHLLSLEQGNCKMAKLTLARLLIAHDAMLSYSASFAHEKGNTEEVLELYTDLMKLDPSHARYYKDQYSLVLMEKVIQLKQGEFMESA